MDRTFIICVLQIILLLQSIPEVVTENYCFEAMVFAKDELTCIRHT